MSNYEALQNDEEPETKTRTTRIASLDVFRGLSVFLMMLVDYAGSVFPIIVHSPWHGVHLADFVLPFFLFVAGVSLALVYKNISNRVEATWKALLRAVKLFFLGVLLQGGYLHGITSLTFGLDIERIRWFGILQRISIGYIVAALCEIWLPCQMGRGISFFRSYYWHWCIVFSMCAVYLGLLYGLYVPDWQFKVSHPTSSLLSSNDSNVYMVTCAVRGDLGPACNAAGMIDRYVLGVDHLYAKPVYRNLKECNISKNGLVSESSPSWCLAPFDPEGILSSLTAAVTCIIGLQYGHILAQIQDHKGRLQNWCIFSVSFFVLGLFLAFIGIPLNKSLYTISYMLITSASAGFTVCALYLLVDVYGYRSLTSVLEWMGMHSLSIFVLISSNLAVIVIQGFYWTAPENNILQAWRKKRAGRTISIAANLIENSVAVIFTVEACMDQIGRYMYFVAWLSKNDVDPGPYQPKFTGANWAGLGWPKLMFPFGKDLLWEWTTGLGDRNLSLDKASEPTT